MDRRSFLKVTATGIASISVLSCTKREPQVGDLVKVKRPYHSTWTGSTMYSPLIGIVRYNPDVIGVVEKIRYGSVYNVYTVKFENMPINYVVRPGVTNWYGFNLHPRHLEVQR